MDDNFKMEDDVNPNYQTCTVCNGDTTNNVWFAGGKCKLDQLTFEQVYFVLQKNPKAKADLLRITTDPTLIQLANETRPINQDAIDDRRAEKIINGNTLPFYTVLRGNTDGSVR